MTTGVSNLDSSIDLANVWLKDILVITSYSIHYTKLYEMYNQLTKYANNDIEEGMFSEQAVFSMQWNS